MPHACKAPKANIPYREGKIRFIGLSEVSARTLRRACKVAHVDALQTEYSPFSLDIERTKNGEKSILDTCKELDIALIAYSPLGRGFLTGSIKSPEDLKGDWRAENPSFLEGAFEKNMEIVHAIDAVVEEVKKTQPNVTQAQVVIAWVMKQWSGIIPIPGTRNINRVKENMGAAQVKLTDKEVKAIRDAAEALKRVGDRYPGEMQGQIDADTPEL